MSLLKSLPYNEYEVAIKFSCDTCREIARIAKLKRHSLYNRHPCPGEQLIRDLDRSGYNLSQYHRLLDIYKSQDPTHALTAETEDNGRHKTGFKPPAKVAILVANEMYRMQSKLRTPAKDCAELGKRLKSLGFIVVMLKDVTAEEMKASLKVIVDVIPEGCYCVTYLAGHGAEMNTVRYFLGVDAPDCGMSTHNAVSVSCVLSHLAQCKPSLCMLLVDACASSIDWQSNPEFFQEVPSLESYSFDGNLVIGYSSSSNEPAYEQVEIACNSESISSVICLDTVQHGAAEPIHGQYAAALCGRVCERVSVSHILERVSRDVANAVKKQTPLRIESGVRKYYLFDSVSGDHMKVLEDLKTSLSSSKLTNYTILN